MFKIAISGKANSGKNTLYEILIEGLGGVYSARQIAFANPIKEAILAIFSGAKREDLYGPSSSRSKIIPGTNITYRKVLCDIGALARSYDSAHWVKELLNQYNICNNSNLPPSSFIVTDLRFPNEHAALRGLGFTLIRLKRNDAEKIDDVSETSQDVLFDSDFDFIIENNGTLDSLRAQAINAIKVLKEKQCRF